MPDMDLKDIARLEELRQARGIAEIAPEAQPIAGGFMFRADPGSWMNSAIGLGFDGQVADDAVEQLIAFHTERGVEPRIEHSPYADFTLTQALERAGFRLRNFETIFYRELTPHTPITTPHKPPHGLTMEIVDPGDAALVREYAITAVSGFFPPDFAVPASYLESIERAVRHPRVLGIVARLDGRIIGAGAMEIVGELSALFGLSVVEAYRRRGVQQAMIAHRLQLARARGARIATIGARPAIATERNVRRMGFQVAYTKVALTRPRENLAPNLE